MSDVERPHPPTNPQPARNMADIARLFLDGVRQPAPNGATPKRIPPQNRPIQPVPATTPKAEGLNPSVVSPAPTSTTPEKKSLPTLSLALTAPSPDAWTNLASAAASLAKQHNATVAILGFHNNHLLLQTFSQTPLRLPPIAGSPDLQLARALFTLRNAVSHWLIAAPTPDSPAFRNLASQIPHWLLITPIDNTSVLASYQQLKRAFAIAPPENPPATFLLSYDPAAATLVHDRLSRAAKKFLHSPLTLHSTGKCDAAPATLLNLPAANDPALWSTILDELSPRSEESLETEESTPSIESALDHLQDAAEEVIHNSTRSAAAAHAAIDHLANVLDPEERAALEAALPCDAPNDSTHHSSQSPGWQSGAIDGAPSEATSENNAASISKIDNGSAQKPTFPQIETPVMLRVLDLSDSPDTPDRPTQWQAVERSLRDLLSSAILLDAKPPLSWAADSCIALTPDGRLHIWTLYQDKGGGVSWFALRQWATENRNLLALTRRDLTLDSCADVGIHIVLPLDTPESTVVSTLMRAPAPHVFLYRLRSIQWTTRRGLIVIPIA